MGRARLENLLKDNDQYQISSDGYEKLYLFPIKMMLNGSIYQHNKFNMIYWKFRYIKMTYHRKIGTSFYESRKGYRKVFTT